MGKSCKRSEFLEYDITMYILRYVPVYARVTQKHACLSISIHVHVYASSYGGGGCRKLLVSCHIEKAVKFFHPPTSWGPLHSWLALISFLVLGLVFSVSSFETEISVVECVDCEYRRNTRAHSETNNSSLSSIDMHMLLMSNRNQDKDFDFRFCPDIYTPLFLLMCVGSYGWQLRLHQFSTRFRRIT